MNTKQKTALTVLLNMAALGWSLCAGAQALAPERPITAEAVDVGETRVTLEISGGTVSDALLALSKQAGLELAISADQADLQKTFTLVVHDKPANEVLEIINATTDLEMEMKRGVLIVRSRAAPVPAIPAPAASRPEPTPDRGDAEDDDDDDRDRRHSFRSWRERFDDHQRFWKKRKKRVEFGRPVVVGKDEHLNTAVSIGDDTTVAGHIDEDAVSIGGTLTVKSGAVVERSAVAVGGRVIIEPGAVVGDDAVAVGGTVDVADDAVLEGDRVSIGIPLPTVGGIAGAVGGILVLNAISAIARSVVLFAIALLLLWLIPRRVEAVHGYLTHKPGISILSGFLLFIAVVPLFVVLALTIIGIPLIPVAAVALVALMLLGLTAVIAWLGERTPVFSSRRTAIKTLAIGFVAFLLLNLIPLLGGIVFLVAVFAGVGAAFQSRFGGRDAV